MVIMDLTIFENGATNDADIESFVTKRLLKGLSIDLNVTGAGCTAFITNNELGDIIYGRNFDFTYSPSLQVFTDLIMDIHLFQL